MNTIILVSALWCATALAFGDDSYFPIKTNAGGEGVTAFESKWFGKSLQRMHEPRLRGFAKDVNADVYRIMMLPSWGNPIVVRVERHGELYSLSARRLDGNGGYDPGKLIEVKDIELSADDSKFVAVLIQNLNFFQLPTDDDVIGTDGDTWIFEGVSRGKYHVAVRWCADCNEPEKRKLTTFLALYSFLLDKSTLSSSERLGVTVDKLRHQGRGEHDALVHSKVARYQISCMDDDRIPCVSLKAGEKHTVEVKDIDGTLFMIFSDIACPEDLSRQSRCPITRWKIEAETAIGPFQ